MLEELTGTVRLFARSGRRGNGGEDGTYVPHRDIRRLIAFVGADPATRPGRGADLGLNPILVPDGQSINAQSLRRSFCVYAAAYPGMDVGIGMQLGHASLRLTGSYMRDLHHEVVEALDDERAKVVQRSIAELVHSSEAIGGPSGGRLMELRAQVVADPARAEMLIARAAASYHLGLTNDCAHREETAACGPGEPKLADHFCAAESCANAVVHMKHLPIIDSQIARYDTALSEENLDPGFERNMRRGRERLITRREELLAPRNDEETMP